MARQTIEFNGLRLKVGKDERILFAHFPSSNLQAAAYDVEQKQLILLFKSSPDKRYCYNNVPPKTFFKMISADSVGAFFAAEIKGAFEFYDEPN